MTEHVLNFHLGDDYGSTFKDAVYTGLVAAIPIRITDVAAAPEPIQLIVRTSDLNTLSPQQKHAVSLDGFAIGELADTADEETEVHTFAVPRELIREGEAQRITVEVVGRMPGLEDDFVLRSLELVGAELRLGWA